MKNSNDSSQDPRQLIYDMCNFFRYEDEKNLTNQVEKLEEAIKLIKRIHLNEPDRGDGPFIFHLLRVATRCHHLGVTNVEIIISALLHASVKNQAKKLYDPKKSDNILDIRNGALSEIRQMFGENVKKWVSLLTSPNWSRIEDQEERCMLYMKYVENIIQTSQEAGFIEMCNFWEDILSLEKISDQLLKRRLCRKYEPVFPLFILAIKHNKLIKLSEKKKNEILNDLNNSLVVNTRELFGYQYDKNPNLFSFK